MDKAIKIVLSASLITSIIYFAYKQADIGAENVLNSNDIIFIGHRGASGYAPEHTIYSYDLAIEKDADYLEIDIQMTRDGELVAFHDSKVDRTTNGEGYLLDHTWNQLKELDAGTWFYESETPVEKRDREMESIPSLKHIFERYEDKVNYYIEIKFPEKYPGIEEKLLIILDRFGLLNKNQPKGKVVIQSYSEESLRTIHKKNSEIPLILLKKYDDKAFISQKEIDEIKEYAQGIGVNYKSLNDNYINKLKGNDLLIHAYIVNDYNELELLMEWGVDGVFTDYLDIKNSLSQN